MPAKRKLAAYTLPMLAFLVLLGLNDLLKKTGGAFWLPSPQYWIYPAQTIICGSLLIFFWREYSFKWPARILFAAAIALVVFFCWIAPQQIFHFAPRLEGFNPGVFAAGSSAYWATIALRFLRLVVVVPLLEEIFWRGFLLRYLIDENFAAVPFGKFTWLSFSVVTIAFCLAHSVADYPAALIAGAFYNFVAYRTKSLASCVLSHAITNLLLGLWIMRTGQWGFW
ncbi:MAG: protease family protein [Verrucomicrobiota bacterium]